MTGDVSPKKAESLFAGEAVFVAGAGGASSIPPAPFPEIAFIGRSNVGKSSLINALTRRKIARTSTTPGRTQELLFFRLGDRLMLVDMPGYGFAKAAPRKIAAWHALIDHYLRERPHLRRLCLLIDARRGLMEADREFMKKLAAHAVPFAAVLTKCDKLAAKQVDAAKTALLPELEKCAPAWPDVFATSAEKGTGLAGLKLFLARSL